MSRVQRAIREPARIARTDPDAPKHAGLSELIVDMRSPGITVSTIEDMTTNRHFCEVTFEDVRVPGDHLVGELNGILEHMEILTKVNTSGVSGAEAVGDAGMSLRIDGGPPYPLAHPRDEFAPEIRDGFFIVPRLATHEDAGESVE